jgi:hypothetical protein
MVDLSSQYCIARLTRMRSEKGPTSEEKCFPRERTYHRPRAVPESERSIVHCCARGRHSPQHCPILPSSSFRALYTLSLERRGFYRYIYIRSRTMPSRQESHERQCTASHARMLSSSFSHALTKRYLSDSRTGTTHDSKKIRFDF